ncbi:hypothetical protein AAJ76_3280001858, partial [Vairimorpha ceranae]
NLFSHKKKNIFNLLKKKKLIYLDIIKSILLIDVNPNLIVL